MSISKFKKEFSDLINPISRENQEYNLSAKIIDSAREIGKKYSYQIEDFNAEHIDYGTTQKNKINILNKNNKSVGFIVLNIYRNEYGKYEYNGYLAPEMNKKLRP